MICIQFDNKLDWLGLAYGSVYDVRSNGVGKNREIDEDHDEDCVEKGFQLTSGAFDRDGEEGKESVGMEYCSVNI